jgi:ATP-dependent Clp protease ATP-binding subunit ClpC
MATCSVCGKPATSQVTVSETAPDREQLDYPALKDRLMELLRRHFRPEFLNRVDEIVVFHALGKEQIRGIVELQLRRVVQTAAAQDIDIEFTPSLVDHLAEAGYDAEFGARMLKRTIRAEVEARLATALLKGEVEAGDHITIGYDKDQDTVTVDKRVEHKAAA